MNKLNSFFEHLFRILILNIISVVLTVASLGFLLLPSLYGIYAALKTIDENKEGNPFKMFFKNVFHKPKKLLILTLIFDILFIILAYNIFIYLGYFGEGNTDSIVYVLFVATLFISFLCLLVFSLIPLNLTYFDLNLWHMVKISIYMAFRYVYLSLLGLLLIMVSILMAFKLTVIFAFVGMSIPSLVFYRLTRNTYKSLTIW